MTLDTIHFLYHRVGRIILLNDPACANPCLSSVSWHRREFGDHHLPLASITTKGTARLRNLPTNKQLIVKETEVEFRALSTVLNSLLLTLLLPLPHYY